MTRSCGFAASLRLSKGPLVRRLASDEKRGVNLKARLFAKMRSMYKNTLFSYSQSVSGKVEFSMRQRK